MRRAPYKGVAGTIRKIKPGKKALLLMSIGSSWLRWNAPLSMARKRGLQRFIPVVAVARSSERRSSRRMPAKLTHKVPLQVLAETVHCYPTQAEVFQRIALQYTTTRKAAATA